MTLSFSNHPKKEKDKEKRMEGMKMALILLCSVLFLASSATACERCVHQSQAAYFTDPSALSRGACGYGSMAVNFNGGLLAGGVSYLFNDGAACGACIQVRCTDSALCRSAGTTVFLFDRNDNNQLDLVLSRKAFLAMAASGKAQELLKRGITDVEYKRVPCNYTKNLAIRVEERSQKPRYLAIKFLYQGGQTDIKGVDIAPVNSGDFGSAFMTRNYGAIWDTKDSTVPEGALQMRLVVTAGYNDKEVLIKNALPSDWTNGANYDTRVQITDIAQEECSPCDYSKWG